MSRRFFEPSTSHIADSITFIFAPFFNFITIAFLFLFYFVPVDALDLCSEIIFNLFYVLAQWLTFQKL